jgi:hypothetical protein
VVACHQEADHQAASEACSETPLEGIQEAEVALLA